MLRAKRPISHLLLALMYVMTALYAVIAVTRVVNRWSTSRLNWTEIARSHGCPNTCTTVVGSDDGPEILYGR